MTDNQAMGSEAGPSVRRIRWLSGRSSRREYWVYIAALVAVSLALADPPPVVSLVASAVLIMVLARRLHDLGRTGWWAAVAIVALPLAVALPIMWATDEQTAQLWSIPVLLLSIVLIGIPRGDAAENRFGPPPPFTVRRVLTGR